MPYSDYGKVEHHTQNCIHSFSFVTNQWSLARGQLLQSVWDIWEMCKSDENDQKSMAHQWTIVCLPYDVSSHVCLKLIACFNDPAFVQALWTLPHKLATRKVSGIHDWLLEVVNSILHKIHRSQSSFDLLEVDGAAS